MKPEYRKLWIFRRTAYSAKRKTGILSVS